MDRFQQVCLPGAVWPSNEDDARLEAKLERRVGADVAKRNGRDDQLAVL
jgi:hypothetical protein